MISYRVFRYETKVVVKTMHFCLQISAFIFVVVSLLAVFSYADNHLTSLHSWIGMIIVIVYGLQVWLTLHMYSMYEYFKEEKYSTHVFIVFSIKSKALVVLIRSRARVPLTFAYNDYVNKVVQRSPESRTWVFSGYSRFLSQGMLTAWDRFKLNCQ